MIFSQIICKPKTFICFRHNTPNPSSLLWAKRNCATCHLHTLHSLAQWWSSQCWISLYRCFDIGALRGEVVKSDWRILYDLLHLDIQSVWLHWGASGPQQMKSRTPYFRNQQRQKVCRNDSRHQSVVQSMVQSTVLTRNNHISTKLM